jgi:hypothetical protein
MMIEGVAGLYAPPWVRVFNDAGVRCVETPVRPDWVNVNIGQVNWMLVWPAVESLFFPGMLCSPKRVCSSGKRYARNDCGKRYLSSWKREVWMG